MCRLLQSHARIVNNTIVGGTIAQADLPDAAIFNGLLFSTGSLAFADAVVTYTPLQSGGPAPLRGSINLDWRQAHQTIRWCERASREPRSRVFRNGGQLILSFTDNLLTGSGDSRPDLVVFEVGVSERVNVAVSTNGTTFTPVGFIDGVNRTIDLDAWDSMLQAELQPFAWTDDPTEGDSTGASVGADIDAVGALSSVLATTYTAGGVGIRVGVNASPTLLNNIVFNNAVGWTLLRIMRQVHRQLLWNAVPTKHKQHHECR